LFSFLRQFGSSGGQEEKKTPITATQKETNNFLFLIGVPVALSARYKIKTGGKGGWYRAGVHLWKNQKQT